MNEELCKEMEETSKRWREEMKASGKKSIMAEKLERNSIVDYTPIVHRMWQKGHLGSFESNHGCWDHFRKIK